MSGPVLKINSFSANFAIYLFIILLIVQGCLSNNCILKQTCGQCIAENPECSWCELENLPENDDNLCDYEENLLKRNCTKIINPENTMDKIKNKELSNKGVTESEAIRVKPQEIRIKLRPKSVHKFQVEFRQAVDYPVDLYYLMDLSNSMADDKEKLAELGNKLADEMKSITTNFKLGFGSFVDKTVAPYVSSHPDKLREPCDGCAAPYAYRNNMPLSSKTHEFAHKVKEAPISGNLDAPEGGFDAIMQAIVCKKEINWRDMSRKLLVYSSDNSYHYAGDGKLGGIVEPNDETCHLDSNGYYTMGNQLDYPSLSQLNRQVLAKNIHIIFAVTKDQADLYDRLSRRLTGSSTGTLDADSSNVVGLVRDQYEKIRSSVKMIDDVGDSDIIKLTYYSKCLGSKLKETNFCEGLQVETNVTFDVELEFKSCPQDRTQWTRTFHIYPVGLQDQLTVHLEMQCECDCEKPENEELGSAKCSSGNGTFECGICSCNSNRYGKECECDGSQTDSSIHCIKEGDSKPCSGRGTCRCGLCYCHSLQNPEEKYDGKHCECSNFNCDKKNGKVCSGPENGICECGNCTCHKGWKGSDCSCKDSQEECMGEGGVLCSGRGECICGSCYCPPTGKEQYFGPRCDDCATCPGKCKELEGCVECWLKNQHGANLNCTICGEVTPVPVDEIEVLEKEKQCTFEDDEDCRISFKYGFNDENEQVVSVRSSKECPTPLPLVAIVSGVAGGVVATGLFLLMLWKVLTTIHDRRELARFEKEKLKAKWNQGQNPIYIEATTTFQNPAYRGD